VTGSCEHISITDGELFDRLGDYSLLMN